MTANRRIPTINPSCTKQKYVKGLLSCCSSLTIISMLKMILNRAVVVRPTIMFFVIFLSKEFKIGHIVANSSSPL